MVKVGDKAPNFSLADQVGKVHNLKDYLGQWVLLYFYPKDDTPGCTKEACAIRDSWGDFKKYKLAVLGVSTDSVESHSKFSKKFDLPFPILADDEKKVVQAYGVWGEKQMMGRTYQGTKRMSFLIDDQGKIAKVYATVKPPIHATQVLGDFMNLTG